MDDLIAAVSATGVTARRIVFEITETSALANVDAAREPPTGSAGWVAGSHSTTSAPVSPRSPIARATIHVLKIDRAVAGVRTNTADRARAGPRWPASSASRHGGVRTEERREYEREGRAGGAQTKRRRARRARSEYAAAIAARCASATATSGPASSRPPSIASSAGSNGNSARITRITS